MFKSSLLTISLAIISQAACSFTMSERYQELDDIAERYEYILKVKILASKVAEYTQRGDVEACGIIYSGVVLDSIRKPYSNKKITFASFHPLKTNREYLIFATERIPPLFKQESFIKNNAEQFKGANVSECANKLPTINTDGSLAAFEFEQGGGRNSKGIIYDAPNVILPSDIKIYNKVYNICPREDSSKNCKEQLTLKILDWDSLRARLSKSRGGEGVQNSVLAN